MAISLAIASVDPTGVLGHAIAAPGRFFYAMLHVAAWWIPLYFLALTIMALRSRPITWESVLLLNVIHVPVLTVGALLRLLVQGSAAAVPLIAALERSFTIRGAGIVLSLALAVQGVVLMQLWRWIELRARGEVGGSPESNADADNDEQSPLTRMRAIALPAPDTAAVPEAATEWDFAAAPRSGAEGEPPADPDLASEVEVAEHEPETPDDSPEPVTFQDQLAALRARMEEGLEKTPSTVERSQAAADPLSAGEAHETYESPQEESAPEPPLPLIFGRRSGHVGVADLESDLEEIGAVVFDEDDDDHDDEDDEFLAEQDAELDDQLDIELDDDELEADSDVEFAAALDDDVEADLDDDLEDLPEPPPMPEMAPVRRTRQKYHVPVEGILSTYSDGRYWEIDDTTRDAAEVLRVTLEEFGIKAEVTGIRKGPVITMFEILPAPGVKLAKITNLSDNIALRLAASSVRIVAPIPGKHAVGIEIPNRERNIVSFAELLQDDEFFESDSSIPIALGKDIAGEAQIVDLAKTPHMLIAGATGSGKSVCVNSIICSVLYRHNPAEVKLILIDPKIVELKFYNDIPHLLTPVITDPKRAFQALQYLIYEMERRYSMLDSLGARDITGFNAKIKRKNLATEPLPYIVVIIDEFADLMATSGKELESTVARLAAMSRAVGIHLVLATQRPSTDVITGLIKANIPSRIAFMVASKVDSRIIIDSQGAEKLLGRGDMLFTSAADPFPVRMQGAFLTEEEVERVVEEVKTFGEPDYIDDEIFIDEDEDDLTEDTLEDPLMEKAIEVVTSSHKASASYLQRRLKVGYNRAARMVEEMERLGIVGPQNGSKPRDVIGSSY
ncbi:MAG: DNA translocase FtsK [Alkalispirochaeta sp.]